MMRVSRFRRWGHARDGAVAVEFALAAIPFFMFVIGLLETAMMYATATVLEGGTIAAARLIRTGQAQASANAQTTFQNAVCGHVATFVPCSALRYEVFTPPANTFGGADGIPPQYDANGNLIPRAFDPGGVSDVVVIRTSYRFQFITPMMATMMMNGGPGNSVRLQSTVTVRNEPYEFED